MKQKLLALAAALCAALLCACSAEELALPDTLQLMQGETRYVTDVADYNGELTAEDAALLVAAVARGDGELFTLTSDDPAVVQADSSGLLTAAAPGRTVVTFACPALDLTVSLPVEVCAAPPAALSVDPLLTLAVGESAPLPLTMAESGGASLVFTSLDPAVAAVDEQGRVTGLADGETPVVVQLPGTSLEAVCVVRVGSAVQCVALTSAAADLLPGQTLALGVRVTPAQDAAPLWQSDAPAVAAVSDAGVVTALQPGTAHISATAGGKTAVCTVTVAAPATPETASPESAATPETAATPESASTPETATPETAAAAGQPAPTLSGFLRRFLGLGE